MAAARKSTPAAPAKKIRLGMTLPGSKQVHAKLPGTPVKVVSPVKFTGFVCAGCGATQRGGIMFRVGEVLTCSRGCAFDVEAAAANAAA